MMQMPYDLEEFVKPYAPSIHVLRERYNASWPLIEKVLGIQFPRAKSTMQILWKAGPLRELITAEAEATSSQAHLDEIAERVRLKVWSLRRKPGPPRRESGLGITDRDIRRLVERDMASSPTKHVIPPARREPAPTSDRPPPAAAPSERVARPSRITDPGPQRRPQVPGEDYWRDKKPLSGDSEYT